MISLNKDLNRIFASAVEAVKPSALIPANIRIDNNLLLVKNNRVDLNAYNNVYLTGAGKASTFMAIEMEKILGAKINGGVVITKYDHLIKCDYIQVIEAGHPVTDENSINASELIIEIAKYAGKDDLILFMLSGGASALLEKIPDEISLTDYQKTISLLLKSGADIHEMNVIRKHISLVKGGQLARMIYPAVCVTIIISDVIGDSIETIGSGPTAPDPSTFKDAYDIVAKYQLTEQVPSSVISYLKDGIIGKKKETVKTGDTILNSVKNILIGNNLTALKAAKTAAETLGYNTKIHNHELRGEARVEGSDIAKIIREAANNQYPIKKPACILFGGETTVTVKGKGKGGRNTELALAALLALKNFDGKYLLASFATDGTDGNTNAAGAVIYPDLWDAINSKGLSPEKYLNDNNSYEFFKQADSLIVTGRTETNVMDLIVTLIW